MSEVTKFTALVLAAAAGASTWVSPVQAATPATPEAGKLLVRAQEEIGRLPAAMPGSENDTWWPARLATERTA